VEVAKALGGSFKLVTPAPKPVREMTQLPRETKPLTNWISISAVLTAGHTAKQYLAFLDLTVV